MYVVIVIKVIKHVLTCTIIKVKHVFFWVGCLCSAIVRV